MRQLYLSGRDTLWWALNIITYDVHRVRVFFSHKSMFFPRFENPILSLFSSLVWRKRKNQGGSQESLLFVETTLYQSVHLLVEELYGTVKKVQSSPRAKNSLSLFHKMSSTALSSTRGSTAYAPGKLIGVLRKPTRSRASSNSSPVTSSAREEELHSAIRQLRIQDGDDGYKKSPRMSSTSTSTSQSASNSDSTSASTSATSGLNSSMLLDDSWRKDGREKRRIILEDDNSNGGSDFHINHQSPLRTYSAIADRVSSLQVQYCIILFVKSQEERHLYPCSALLYSALLYSTIKSHIYTKLYLL